VSNLNIGISFLSQTESVLQELVDIVDKVVVVADKASRGQTGSPERARLNGEFRRLAGQFNEVLGRTVNGDISLLSEEDLTNTLVGIGLDPETSESVAALIKKFKISEADNIGSDAAQAPRPVPYAKDRTFIGDGTLQAAVTFTTIDFATIAQSGDFNNDGILDVVDHDTTLSIRLGTGDATFAAPATINTVGGGGTQAIGDFNGDGNLDIISTVIASTSNLLSLGNGDGTFSVGVTLVAASPSDFIRTADLTGDGVLDIVMGVQGGAGTSELSVFIGNGNGTFAARVTLASTLDPVGVTIGDFNGDGKQDIAALDMGSPTLSVFFGNGNGTFQAPISTATGATGPNYGFDIQAADVNLDGRADLITSGSSEANISVFLGNGNGTFAARTSYALPGTSSYAFSLGDVTGDGLIDIIAASADGLNSTPGSGKISILQGNSNGTFALDQTISSAGGHAIFPTVADFTGDGIDDIAFGHGTAFNGFSIVAQDSTEQSVRAPGRFSSLFSSSRTIKTRSDAYGLLADAKAVRDELKNNLKTVKEGIELIEKNMSVVREAGLALLDLSSSITSGSSASAIAFQVSSTVRARVPGAAQEVQNLNPIVAAVLLRGESVNS
jgi:flagellin-like hook-associated protein FlgL